jgi:hypothetical protein
MPALLFESGLFCARPQAEAAILKLEDFAIPVPVEALRRTAEKGRERNSKVVIVDGGDAARRLIVVGTALDCHAHAKWCMIIRKSLCALSSIPL